MHRDGIAELAVFTSNRTDRARRRDWRYVEQLIAWQREKNQFFKKRFKTNSVVRLLQV